MDMDIYEETHINLLVRLTREAHEPTTTPNRYIKLGGEISDI